MLLFNQIKDEIMIDDRFLVAGITIMLVIIINDLLKRFTKFDMDKIDVSLYFKKFLDKIKNIIKN